MLLGPGEGIVRSEYAVLLDGHGTGIVAKTAGVLYLTNHRCVFETSVSRGVVGNLTRGREPRIVLDAPLLSLRNLTVQRPRLGKPRLRLETTHAHAAFDVLEPEVWVTAVTQARQALPSPHASPPPPATSTHTIERQVVKVRCRYCGTLGNEIDGRCHTCGGPL